MPGEPELKKASPISVLLVDDSLDFREIVAFSLRNAGFNVCEASGGNEAFEKIKLQQFDAIVSDVQMPLGDGIKLLTNIRVISPSLPVILMTGNPFLQSQLENDPTLTALLCKPFVNGELVELLKRIFSETQLPIAL